MRRFDLRVQVPLEGTFYAGLWSSHNEGQHIVLAKSVQGLEQTLRAVFAKYLQKEDLKFNPDLTWEIRVVTPPASYCERIETAIYEEAVSKFKQRVQGLLTFYCDRNTLPPQFKPCSCKDRYGCEECDWMTAHLNNCTWENLFEQFSPELEALEPKLFWFREFKPATAPMVEESELDSVYVLSSDFGHHHRGLTVSQISQKEYVSLHALFYFQKVRSLNLFHLSKELKEMEKAYEQEQQTRQEVFREARKIKDLEEKQKYSIFFEKMRLTP